MQPPARKPETKQPAQPPREQAPRDKKPADVTLPKEKAPDYHRQKWEETNRKRQTEPTRPQTVKPPANRPQTPAKAPKPAKTNDKAPRSRN
ncbi:MAG: hypothetical protein IPN33_25765 [Saprospiraceae bacterium]|nr:hypothetical protein [Saprospiraceae bacterium]